MAESKHPLLWALSRPALLGCLLFALCVLPLAKSAGAQTEPPPGTQPGAPPGTDPGALPGDNIPVTGTNAGGETVVPVPVTGIDPVTVSAPVTVPVPAPAVVPITVPVTVPVTVPTPAAVPAVQSAPVPGTVLRNANLRGGPGTNYPIVGKAPAGTLLSVVEATADGTWYYLADGSWIAAFLVELATPLTPAQTWTVVPGQPATVFTSAVTTIITTTVTTVDAAGNITVTTTTSAGPAPGSMVPVVAVPGPVTSIPVAAAPMGPVPLTAPGPLTPTLVISQLLPTDVQSATLVAVTEGDVIQVDINGVRELVRYIGVEAPDPSQPGFATATAANQRLVAGKELLLQREQTDRDPQNRLLRHVFVVERDVSSAFNGGFAGIYANGQLVADGWALPVVAAPDVSRGPELERWGLDASRAGRGFWGGSGGADNAAFAITRASAPLFSGPGADNGADAVLAVDTPLNVLGRSPDGAWIQVRTPRRDEGWVFVPQVSLTAPVSQLPVTSNASGPTPVPQAGQAAVVPVNPLVPGQPGVPTPFPGQPAAVPGVPTPFPGAPTPFPGQPTPFPGQPGVPTPFPGQPAPVTFGPTVIITANLRSGPGTVYPVVGTALAGAPITITARSGDATWLQTSNNTWLAAGLVSGIAANTLPQFITPATPVPTVPPDPTPVLVVPPGATAPTPTITPTPSPTATPLGNPTPTFTPVPPTPLVRLIALDRGSEWVILYNDGTGTQDLAGWVLVSETGDQRCPLQGKLAPRESLRVWAQVGPDGFSCGFPQPIWENAGPDAAVLLDAYGDEVSRIQ